MRAASAFATRRTVLGDALRDAEAAIAEFREKNGVTDVETEMSRVNARLGAAEASYDARRLELLALGVRAAEVKTARETGNLQLVREVKQDPGYQRIISGLRNADSQRSEVLTQLGKDSAQVRVWDRQIASLESQAAELAEAIADQVEVTHASVRSVIDELQSIRDERRSEQGQLGELLIEQSRLESARGRLEQSKLPIHKVASQCGYGTADGMRVAFDRNLGVGPSEYRRRFTTS